MILIISCKNNQTDSGLQANALPKEKFGLTDKVQNETLTICLLMEKVPADDPSNGDIAVLSATSNPATPAEETAYAVVDEQSLGIPIGGTAPSSRPKYVPPTEDQYEDYIKSAVTSWVEPLRA